MTGVQTCALPIFEALKGERLIVHRLRRSPRPYEAILSACREAGFAADLAIQSPTARSQLAAVRSGLGIALVPSILKDSPVPEVVFRPLQPPIPLTGIALLWTNAHPRWHLDHLAAMLGERLHQAGIERKSPRSNAKSAKAGASNAGTTNSMAANGKAANGKTAKRGKRREPD